MRVKYIFSTYSISRVSTNIWIWLKSDFFTFTLGDTVLGHYRLKFLHSQTHIHIKIGIAIVNRYLRKKETGNKD